MLWFCLQTHCSLYEQEVTALMQCLHNDTMLSVALGMEIKRESAGSIDQNDHLNSL